jgi:hypothetical protein
LTWYSGQYTYFYLVLNYEVVLSNGTIVDASPNFHSGLFWALKGGGNHFGKRLSFNSYPRAYLLDRHCHQVYCEHRPYRPGLGWLSYIQQQLCRCPIGKSSSASLFPGIHNSAPKPTLNRLPRKTSQRTSLTLLLQCSPHSKFSQAPLINSSLCSTSTMGPVSLLVYSTSSLLFHSQMIRQQVSRTVVW